MISVSALVAVVGVTCVCLTFILTVFVTYTKATNWLNDRFTDIKDTLSRFETTLGTHARELTAHSQRMDRYESRYVRIANRLQRILGRMDYDRRKAKGSVNGFEEEDDEEDK